MKLEEINKLLGEITQGEWSEDDEDGYALWCIWRKEKILCKMVGDDAETEANARLIAAAPTIIKDLLARNEELQREKEKMQAVVDAAKELVEVATLRGDNDLPHPSDDPKLWSGRMQDAWIDIEHSLSNLDAKEQDDD